MRGRLQVAPAIAAMLVFASGAADARTTAAEVVDRESLRGFVETAKSHLEGITDLNEIARLRVTLRSEGEWKSGDMFLMITFTNGDVFIHGDDPAAESRNLTGVEDDNGVKVVEKLLEGAGEGGGFVGIRGRRAEDRLCRRVHLGTDGEDARRGGRILPGRVRRPSHDRRLAPAHGHRIGSRGPGHADQLRRGGGKGLPGRRDVGRLQRPREREERAS